MSYDITSPAEIKGFLKGLSLSRVLKLYNGRAGCACGCKGDYTEGEALTTSKVKRKVNHMLKLLDDLDSEWDSAGVCLTSFFNEGHVMIERNERMNVIYFKTEGA